GAVGEVDHGQAGGNQRVGVGGAAAGDPHRLIPTGAQRALGGAHRRRGGRGAVAGEGALGGDVDVAFALGEVGRLVHAVQQLGEDLLGALAALGAHLGEDRAALGDDVDRGAAGDRADVGGRVRIDPAEAHVGDG